MPEASDREKALPAFGLSAESDRRPTQETPDRNLVTGHTGDNGGQKQTAMQIAS